jgi:hypothetical protein
MLRIDERWLDVPVEARDFRHVVAAMRSDEWVPAIARSREQFYGLASVTTEYEPFRDPRLPSSQTRELDRMSVEVFFAPSATFVLMFVTQDRYWAQPGVGEELRKGIVVMCISRDGEGGAPEPEIEKFCGLVRSAVSSALDGRRTRHWSTEWQIASATRSRLDRIKELLTDEDVPLVLTPAEADPDVSQGAEVLADRRTR